jgi:hypothetical protein
VTSGGPGVEVSLNEVVGVSEKEVLPEPEDEMVVVDLLVVEVVVTVVDEVEDEVLVDDMLVDEVVVTTVDEVVVEMETVGLVVDVVFGGVVETEDFRWTYKTSIAMA